MGTWLVNRASGLIMIVLMGIKLVSGLYLLPEEDPSWALTFHRHVVLDVMLIFLICLHACFGLKTILFEIGLFKEKILSYAATAISLTLSIIAVILYLRMS